VTGEPEVVETRVSEGGDGEPDIVWTQFGPLSVAVTRSLFDGKLIVTVEAMPDVPEDQQVEVRVISPDAEPEILWEGSV
jgi:hypothetical protein